MADINQFALQQAERAAAMLWALGSAPFPLANGAIIQSHIEQSVTDIAIALAIHSAHPGQHGHSREVQAR